VTPLAHRVVTSIVSRVNPAGPGWPTGSDMS
jgi:hypothetical protein